MRGKGVRYLCEMLFRGITPAYAGKRRRDLRRAAETRDHPRVCGEKVSVLLCSQPLLGSPPRMRGKGRRPKTSIGGKRITPAYAGKRDLKKERGRNP